MIEIKDKLISITEAAKLLNVTRGTLFKWLKGGKVETVKIGRHWKIRQSVVESIMTYGLETGD